MLVALAAAAAAAFSAPVPIDATLGLTIWHFPTRGVPTDGLVSVAVELTVNPHGYVSNCRSYEIYGNPNMGPYSCQIVRRTATFRPARDAAGKRTYGVYRKRLIWKYYNASTPQEAMDTADLEVQLPSPPAGAKLPTEDRIMFVVDRSGKVVTCAPEGKEGRAVLAAAACGQISQKFRIDAAKDPSGRAVPSVQDICVRFTLAPPTSR